MDLVMGLREESTEVLFVAALTQREKEVIRCLLIGKSAKQIARDLTISHRTVEQHIANIKNKFGCKTKLELASMIFNYGLDGLCLKNANS